MNDKIVQLNLGPVWGKFFGSDEAISLAAALLTVEDPRAQYIRKGSWQWNGKVEFYQRGGNRFLSGLAWRLQKGLQERGYAVQIVDRREPVGVPYIYADALVPDPPDVLSRDGFGPRKRRFTGELGEHQVKGVEHAFAVRRCALQIPTGGGKTLVGAEIIRRSGFQTLWMVSGDRLIDQTIEVLKLRLPEATVGKMGGGKREYGMIVVGSVKTLLTIPENDPFWKMFQLLIIDEAHHSGSDTWSQVAQRVPAAMRIGLSGTIERRAKDPVRDLRIEGITGPTLEVIDHEALVEEGFLAKPTVIFLRPPESSYPHYAAIRDVILPNWRDKPQALMTQGHKLYGLTYERGIVSNPQRNLALLRTAQGHAGKGDKVVVLLTQIGHAVGLAESLKRFVGTRFPVWSLDGQASPRIRDQVLGALAQTTTTGCVLFATPFFREGLDIPEIDVLVLGGGGKSDVAVLQGIGRALRPRPDKATVLIYDIWDGYDQQHKANYLRNHSMERLEVYKERKFSVVQP